MDGDIDDFINRNIQENMKKVNEAKRKENQEKIEKLLEKSGLRKKFRNKTFDNFNTKEVTPSIKKAYETAKTFALSFDNQKRGLLLRGRPGVGKTHLTAAITNALTQELYTVASGNAADLITTFKNTYGKNPDITEYDLINIMMETDLIIIDDLGKEYATENTKTLIYQLINRISEEEKLLVVTTNSSSEEIIKKYGERGEAILSRLGEMCIPIILEGEDWRLRKC